jgi:UDPglucose 6-dehydrogenase
MDVARSLLGDDISYAPDAYSVLKGSDALVILTEWNEFRSPAWDKMRSLLKAPVIFDGRNLYQPQDMKDQGFSYYSIGRPAV